MKSMKRKADVEFARIAILGVSQMTFGIEGDKEVRGVVMGKIEVDEDPAKKHQYVVGLKLLLQYPEEFNGKIGWCWWEKNGGAIFHVVE